jgi:4-amino-4-deoxy-L-arabinose transferase-like glycosyltransferase
MLHPGKKDYVGHVLVTLVALAIFIMSISRSGLWFPDMPSHALNGIFYKDMIEERGFLHPKSYAERYYVQYPSLTVGMYPPIFYLTEALSFKILGLSPLSARLTVLLFTLIGINVFLLMCRLWFPVWLSVLATVLLLLQPSMLFGQQNVMLEIPFLAVSMIALYCLYGGLERNNPWLLFWGALFSSLAFLTRQSAVFLLPMWPVWIGLNRKWEVIRSGHLIWGAIVGGILLAPWAVVNFTAARGHLSHLVVLSIASVLLFGSLKRKASYRFALVWFGGAASFLLTMKLTEPRYAIALVPAVIILSMHAVLFLWEKFPVVSRQKTIWVLIVIVLVGMHFNVRRILACPEMTGFKRVADLIVEDSDCVSVLYDGYYNGNFILHMRMRDKDKRVFVFRASKVIFSTNFQIDRGYNELVANLGGFLDLLDRYSIKYIVEEKKDLLKTPANSRLRQWLHEPEFMVVQEIPVIHRGLKSFGSLLVYKYKGYQSKTLGSGRFNRYSNEERGGMLGKYPS